MPSTPAMPFRRLAIELDPASPLFAGHFPGHPILPGIAQLAFVEQALGGSLAAVRSLRLRRPVVPGEPGEAGGGTLDLSLGAPDGEGWVRFEIRHRGEMVSNGAVRPAPFDPSADDETAATGEVARDLHPLPPLPHAPPALLVRGVVAASPGEIVCTAEVPAGHPLVRAGRFPALLGIEAGAQAAAALEAMPARRGGGGEGVPRIGYLVGVREAAFAAATLPAGRPFRVTARLQGSAPPLAVYEIAAGGAGRERVRGTISTFLTGE